MKRSLFKKNQGSSLYLLALSQDTLLALACPIEEGEHIVRYVLSRASVALWDR